MVPGNGPQEKQTEAQQQPQAGGRRRGLKRLAVLALLTATVWLLPPVVARSPILPWLVRLGAADLKGTVSIDAAELGWLSPVRLDGLAVLDRDGQTVLEADRLISEKSLAAMLLGSSELGTFHLHNPRLSLVLDDQGSNAEELLGAYLDASPEKTASARVGFQLEISGGVIDVREAGTHREWHLEPVDVELHVPSEADQPIALQAAAAVAADPVAPGSLSVALSVASEGGPRHEGEAAASPAPSQLTVEAQAAPAALLGALLGRFLPDTRMHGSVSGRVDLAWVQQSNEPRIEAEVELRTPRLVFVASAWGDERLQLERLNASTELTWDGRRLELRPSSIRCQVGEVSASGTLDLAAITAGSEAAGALRQTWQLRGQVDLARLAQMLPRTLRLREALTITSGNAQFRLASQPDDTGMLWQGRLETSDLIATHRGRPMRWPKPILATLTARETADGPVVDDLRCRSEFLQLHAAGTKRDLVASASFDLRRLTDSLRQFVTLDGLDLGGTGWLHFRWLRSDDRRFAADLETQIDDFRLTRAGRPPWDEKRLSVFLSTEGRTDFGTDTQLDVGSLQLVGVSDRAEVKLTGPVLDFRGGGTWPLSAKLQGRLDAWPTRLAEWFQVEPDQISGDYRLTATGSASAQTTHVAKSRLTLDGLRWRSAEMDLRQEHVEVEAVGRWEQTAGRLGLERLTVSADKQGGDRRGQSHFRGEGALAKWDVSSAAKMATVPAKPLRADLSGEMLLSAERPTLQLTGTLGYDAATISAILQEQFGLKVRFVGQGEAPIDYRGPLRLAEAEASTTLDWESANLYGFLVGPGQLTATLSEGRVRFEPLDLPFSQGRLLLTPTLRLVPEPREIHLPAGPVIRQAQITPEMCNTWLKYLAPVLADVTTAEGRFSMDLEHCRVDANRPEQSKLAGRLTVHTVEIGPGPLVRELAVLLGRPAPARLRRESAVPFEMVDGRIYHRDLELVFPDVTIRTQGSVGLDQSLNILAEMPVPPKWIGNNTLGTALRGQTIRLPIGGTLSKPKIDQRTMDRLNQQFLENAARNVLEDELNKQLQRLLGPKP